MCSAITYVQQDTEYIGYVSVAIRTVMETYAELVLKKTDTTV